MPLKTYLTIAQILLAGVGIATGIQILAQPSEDIIPPQQNGIGIIESYSKTEKRTGIFTLTGTQTGITAAHILTHSPINSTVSLNGEKFQISSWEKPDRPNKAFPAEDIAYATLKKAPPESIKRIPISKTRPDQNQPILIARHTPSGVQFAKKILIGGKEFCYQANTPHPIYKALLWLNNDPAGDTTSLKVGDSGGPWLQNGKVIGVTSAIQPLQQNPSRQILYATATSPTEWEFKFPPPNRLALKPTLVSLFCLLLLFEILKRNLEKKEKRAKNLT